MAAGALVANHYNQGMNFVELAIPFFILAMAIELAYGAWKKNQTYRLNDALASLMMGSLSQLIGVLRLSFAAVVIASAVQLLGVVAWAPEYWWHWVAAFVAYDFCYYWKHRFGHEWRILWASHSAHHQSEEYNLSTALRQTSTDYIGFVFYLPMYLAGTPAYVMISVGTLNLVYQFWVHTQHVNRLGILDYVLVTPSIIASTTRKTQTISTKTTAVFSLSGTVCLAPFAMNARTKSRSTASRMICVHGTRCGPTPLSGGKP